MGIKDVAKKAGVSTATVSRVLNNSGYVSADTRVKILKVVDELGFVPNFGAQMLRTNRSMIIALIIETLEDSFFVEFVSIVEKECMLRGYKLILCNIDNDIKKESAYIKMIEHIHVDGVIVATGSSVYKQINGTPVLLSEKFDMDESSDNDIVGSSNVEGAKMAVQHLIDIGCKKIVHITPRKRTYTSKKRLEGFLYGVNKNKISKQLLEYNHTSQIKEFDYSNIDGIFVWNDETAIELMFYLLQNGYKIPEDIKIVGYENNLMSKKIYPSLTTIEPNKENLAKLSVDILVNRIENRNKHNYKTQNIVLTPQLIIRKSTSLSETY